MAPKSKRKQAFELFDKGFLPNSPEVKALGLKSTTRGNYYTQWGKGEKYDAAKKRRKTVVDGETIGAFSEDITVNEKKIEQQSEVDQPEDEPIDPDEETESPDDEPIEENSESNPDISESEGDVVEEDDVLVTMGEINEAGVDKKKNGKKPEKELKIATTVVDNGIRCTVFLSLNTLTLYKMAAATQAEMDGKEPLKLSDFLDTCVEDFFAVRGKKLGLIVSGKEINNG